MALEIEWVQNSAHFDSKIFRCDFVNNATSLDNRRYHYKPRCWKTTKSIIRLLVTRLAHESADGVIAVEDVADSREWLRKEANQRRGAQIAVRKFGKGNPFKN